MRIPKHVGIIPDGNRRWASINNLSKHLGYEKGLKPGLDLLKLCIKYNIEEITYYGFTTDNCKRPSMQCKAFAKACVDAVNLIISEPVSLLVVGNTKSEKFPKELLKYTTRTDINGGGIKVNFLVNYGWEWDLSNINSNNNRKSIFDCLKSKEISRIDLVVRWGGNRRLSGFLPVQCVYSDFYILDNLWPDFKDEHFTEALNWYDRQDVTLGG